MMNKMLPALSLLMLCLACSQTDKTTQNVNETTPNGAPIEGSWELVETLVDGKAVKPARPQQFKLLHDGFFSFIHYKPDGSFQEAGAGTYKLDGKQYNETLRYCSDPALVGASDWQEWKIDGDTLYFYAFKKAIDKTGKDLTEAWGKDKYIEKRVRAKQ